MSKNRRTGNCMHKIMNVRHLLPLFVVLLAALLTACVPVADTAADTNAGAESQGESTANALADLPKNDTGYVDITVAQLAAVMPQKDFTLVNVHVPFAGDLPNTDLSIPFDDIQQLESALPDKEAPIVLYCRSGNMSTQTAQWLVDLGYTNLYELDGGMNVWQSAGNKLLLNQ